MGTYIGKVQIGNDSVNLISLGDTLYGECATSASEANKIVTLDAFDRVLDGISVRVKFTNGNTTNTNVTLKVGASNAYGILGDCLCTAGEVLCFTWEQGTPTSYWRVTSGGLSQTVRDFVSNATSSLLNTAHGMVFKGTLGTNGNILTVPTGNASANPSQEYYAGWTYKVITAGTYAGITCEVGDLLIAIADSISGQTAVNNEHWTVAQGNLDGTVTGPVSSTNNHIAIFDQDTGKIIKDSGFTIETSVPQNALFTDHQYTLTTGANAYTSVQIGNDNDSTILASISNGVLILQPGIKFGTTAVGTALADATTSV